jgi:HD-like signal output (HDOD) protein
MPESSLLHILYTKIENKTLTLPTLPDVAVKVMSIIDAPEINSSDLCRAISRDSGISIRLIKLANSAHFGRSIKITTLQQAVVRLGFRQVRSLVIAMAMEQLFISTDSVIHNKLQSIWHDSIRITSTAMAYDFIMHRGKYSDTLMLLGTTCRLGMLTVLTEIEKTFSADIFPKVDYTNLTIIEKPILLSLFKHWEFPQELINILVSYFDRAAVCPQSCGLIYADKFGDKKFEECSELVELDKDIFDKISELAKQFNSILR